MQDGFDDHAVWHKRPTLVHYRRGTQVLFLEPDSLDCQVLREDFARIVFALQQPKNYFQLQAAFPEVNPEHLKTLLITMFQQGIVERNGKLYTALQPAAPCACEPKPKVLFWEAVNLGKPEADKALHELKARYPELQIHLLTAANFSLQSLDALVTAGLKPVLHRAAGELDAAMLDWLGGCPLPLALKFELPDQESCDCARLPGWEHLSTALRQGLEVAPVFVIRQAQHILPLIQALAQIECRIFKLEFNFDFKAAQSFAQAYLEALRWVQAQAAEHTNFWHIYPLRQFILTIHKQIQPWLCHASPCAAGERLWYFDAEAKLWACTFKHPKLFLGGLAQLQDLDFMVQSSAVIQELTSRRLINLPRCSRCAFRQLCGGGCPARSLSAYGDLLREDPQCYFLQMVFEGLLWLLVEEREGMFYLGGALG